MTEWTRDMVEDRVMEAAAVLRKLPGPRVRGYFSTWPDIVLSAREIAGQEPKPMKVLPSPMAISRMEETLAWLRWLEPADAKIVWLRANGERWKTICWKVGLARTAANQRWLYALCVIAWKASGRTPPRGRSRQHVIELARAEQSRTG